MKSLRFTKNIRKSSSPIKTPEKTLPIKQTQLKRTENKPNPQTPKKHIIRSLSQIAYLEELKQQSLRIIDGVEKLRRVIAFSKYRPCLKTLKHIYYDESIKIKKFVYMKTILKVWEILRANKKNTEICRIINSFNYLYYDQDSISQNFYKKNLMLKALNGLMIFYCSSAEVSQMLSDFYNKNLLKKCFSTLCMSSKYDTAVESFYKVI